MKQLLTVTLFLIASMASAQIVNIPDPAFKLFLITEPGIDANGDGEIQLSEALAVDTIWRSSATGPVYDLTGIRSFANLRLFWCAEARISSLDVSGMTELRRLE